MDRTRKFTEKIIDAAFALYRQNKEMKKDELICKLKKRFCLRNTLKGAEGSETWKLHPRAVNTLLSKIAAIVILTENSAERPVDAKAESAKETAKEGSSVAQ